MLIHQSLWVIASLLRLLGVGTLGGIAAGLIAGLGARIAMRIVAITAGPPSIGLITGNGNTVGEITLVGSAELVAFAALFFGLGGGLLYAAMRPWVARLGRWRGVTFGMLLLATFGSALITPSNRDFSRFGSPLVNVVLFAVLFPGFGLAVAFIVDGLDRALPTVPPKQPLQLGAYALTAIAGLFALFLVGMVLEQAGKLIFAAVALGDVGALLAMVLPGTDEPAFLSPPFLLFSMFVVGLVVRALLGYVDREPDVARRRAALVTSSALVAVPVLVGFGLTVQAIAKILTVNG